MKMREEAASMLIESASTLGQRRSELLQDKVRTLPRVCRGGGGPVSFNPGSEEVRATPRQRMQLT